jgi:PHP family Zn ribbon phosphoesterase
MTRGVAERLGYFKRSDRTPPESIKIVPLLDILMNSCGTNSKTSRQEKIFMKAVEVVGNEYYILLEAGADELAKCFDDATIGLILAARSGNVSIIPGYDGEYGRLSESNC